MNEQELSVYEGIALRHNAAFAAFKSIYEAKNPLPILAKPDPSDWYIAIGVMVLVVASVLVSGSRTVFEFGGGLIGIAAFVMLECAIVAYAFIRTKTHFNEQRMESVKRLMSIGLGLAFAVAIAANVDATLKENKVITADWIHTVILVLVAISAPSLALISGDILGLEYMRSAAKQRRITEDNAEKMTTWNDGLNRAWASQQKAWGVKVDIQSESVQLPSLSNGISNGNAGNLPSKSTLGFRRKPDATKKVREYFEANPDAITGNPLEIAAMLEVGKSTVYNVMAEIKNGK